MTVGLADPRVEYTEDGSTTIFSVPYPFFDDGDLIVTRFTGAADSQQSTLILGHDYSVSGGDTGDGPSVGSITLLTASVAAATLRIDRHTPRTQELHYEPGDDFPARSHEDGLDRGIMIDQEMDRDQLTLEGIVDYLATYVLKAGAGIRIDYDDDKNTITITATGIEQAIADLPDCVMLSGDQQTFTGTEGDPGNTGGLTAADVKSIVADMIVNGTGIGHSYDALTGKLTITNTLPEDGLGGGGGALGALLTDIQATGIGANEILVGDGTNSVARKSISAFVQGIIDEASAAAFLAAISGLGVAASSLGSPGYIKFTNNLKISWGSISCAGDTTTAVTYPSAYGTFAIPSGSGGYTGHDQPDNCRIIGATNTGFTVVNNDNIAATFWWIAIGV